MKPTFLFFFLILTLLTPCFTTPYPLPVLTSAGQIWDFYTRSGPGGARSFAEQWLVEPFVPYAKDKLTLCNGNYWLGGAGVSSGTGYFERVYKDLPAHNFAYFSIPIGIINSWSSPDSFSIYADGTLISVWTPSDYSASSCETLGRTKSIGGKFAHTGDSLTLKIAFNLYTPNTFLLFRDINFSFRSSAATETPIAAKWDDAGCPANSPSCTACSDSQCNICFSNGIADCARCNWLKTDYGSGCKSCAPNCSICSGPGSNQCTLCALTYILNPDGTCGTSCPGNMMKISTPAGYSFCVEGCPAGEYMNWNYTCRGECDAPLKKTAEGFCEYPCTQENGEYLYWDGRCESTCPYTARNESWYFFCDACPEGEWSYQNKSCLSTCQQYFKKTSQGGSKFCNYPCETNEFLYQDGSCRRTCKPFYSERIEQGMFNFCDYPCQKGSWLNSNGKCSSLSNTTQDVLKGTQKASTAITQASSFLTSGGAITVSASVAGRIFFNIKFLNISYSEELQDALKEWSPSFISEGVTPDIPDSIVRKIPKRDIPYMFSKYDDDISSSFLLNFYDSLGMLVLAGFVLIALVLLEALLKFLDKTETTFAGLVKKGKIMAQNFLVASLYGVYGDLVLYAILEYRTIQFKSDLALLSFFLSLILLILMFIGLGIHLKILKKYQKIKRQDPDALEDFTEKTHPGLQVLYRDYTDKTISRQAFLVTLTIREIFFSFVICTMFDYPLMQTAIFCVNNFFMIVYLIDRRPFKSKGDLAQQVFFELIGLAVNSSVLLNGMYHDNETAVKRIGKFVIGMNLLYNFSVAGLMLWQICMVVKEQWQAYKLRKKNKIVRLAAVHRRLDESSMMSLEQNTTTQQNLPSGSRHVNFIELQNCKFVKRPPARILQKRRNLKE